MSATSLGSVCLQYSPLFSLVFTRNTCRQTHSLLSNSQAASGVSYNFSLLDKKFLDVLHVPEVGQGPYFYAIILHILSVPFLIDSPPPFVCKEYHEIICASQNVLHNMNIQQTVALSVFNVYNLYKNTLSSMRAGNTCHVFSRTLALITEHSVKLDLESDCLGLNSVLAA